MEDDEDTPDVVVEVTADHNEEPEPPVVEDGDTIVVVSEPAESGASDGEVERAVETAVTIESLRGDIADLWSAIFDLQSAQISAAEDAEEAVAVADDAEEEVADLQEEIESEIEPASAKTHPLFRPLSEWRAQ